MAVNKPTRPDSELPETWGGTQYPYTEEEVENGYLETVPQIVDGGKLNYQMKGIFERLKYTTAIADVINNTPIGQVPAVDQNNRFEYRNLPVISSDDEYSEGVSTVSSPSVKQVTDSFLDLSGKITNCTINVPQDIKLGLNDGTLAAKQGSKVWIPYGTTEAYKVGDVDAYGHTVVATSWDGSKFFYAVKLQSDLSYTNINLSNQPHVAFIDTAGNLKIVVEGVQTHSGATAPTVPAIYMLWYDTTNNLVKYSTNSGASYYDDCSLPIAVLGVSGNKMTSIDQIFNGFVYIGSTISALPGVRGLSPNYKNADGTLKNIEFTLNKVLTFTSGNYTYDDAIMVYRENSLNIIAKENWYYNQNDNICYNYFMELGRVSAVNGNITSFTPKRVFKAADDQDVPKLNGKNTFNGENTFIGGFHLKAPNASGKEGAEVNWGLGETSVLRKGVKQDVYENSMRFFTENSKGETVNPVAIDFEENSLSVNNFLRIRSSNSEPSRFISGRIERGSKPTSNELFYVDFLDKNIERMGVIGVANRTDGYYGVYLQAGNEGSIGVFSNGSSATTHAITPIQCVLEDSQLATTMWTNNSVFCKFVNVADINSGYVTPHVGFIVARAGGNNRSSYVDFNGHRVFDSGWSASYGSPDNIFIPVAKGVTITYGSLNSIKFFYNISVY